MKSNVRLSILYTFWCRWKLWFPAATRDWRCQACTVGNINIRQPVTPFMAIGRHLRLPHSPRPTVPLSNKSDVASCMHSCFKVPWVQIGQMADKKTATVYPSFYLCIVLNSTCFSCIKNTILPPGHVEKDTNDTLGTYFIAGSKISRQKVGNRRELPLTE